MSAKKAAAKESKKKPAKRAKKAKEAEPKLQAAPEVDEGGELSEPGDEDELGTAPSGGPDDPATRYDPVLDRRIIEGMLTDRKALLEDLAKEGIKPGVVMRRAADLGLSEAYIRQVQGVAADLAGERPGHRKTPMMLGARTCLSCDRVFLSAGPGNRLCMRCRGGDAGLAQL